MDYLILSGHSAINEPIAKLTAKNKWDYSARHGYDLITMRYPWSMWKEGNLKRIYELLPLYRAILTVGSDVLFMNQRFQITDVSGPQDNIVMAEEHMGDPKDNWSQINNDVMIWANTEPTKKVLLRLIEDTPKWIDGPQLWQRHLQELILGESPDPEIKSAIRLVAPRVMNATHEEGIKKDSKWEMGDWIFHALCGPNERKYQLLQYYLQMVTS